MQNTVLKMNQPWQHSSPPRNPDAPDKETRYFEILDDERAQPNTAQVTYRTLVPWQRARLGLRGGGSQRIAVSRQIEARERIHVSTYHVTHGRVEHKLSSVYNAGWELA